MSFGPATVTALTAATADATTLVPCSKASARNEIPLSDLFAGLCQIGTVTPTALGANTDNWASATGIINRISSDAARNLTGIVAEGNGALKFLWNIGTFPITLVNELTSTAANRFTCAGGASIVLGPGELALLTYSTTTSRWLTTKVRSDIAEGSLTARFPGGTSIQTAVINHDGSYAQLGAGTTTGGIGVRLPTGNTWITGSCLLGGSAAAGLHAVSNNVTGPGQAGWWFQNSGGSKRVATSDVTNATVTPTNITGISVTTIAGRKYAGRLVLFCSDSTAADGILFDFDGGTGTWTSFRAAITGNVQGATLGVTQSTAIATDLTATAMNGTGQHCIVIEFAGVANAAGTFIPRMAQNAHSTGTASVHVDSFMLMDDVP